MKNNTIDELISALRYIKEYNNCTTFTDKIAYLEFINDFYSHDIYKKVCKIVEL